jgi:hypothetical protein
MVLLITYDLNAPGKNYDRLYEEIKKAGTWWHHLDSTWLIETQSSPQQWYERLAPHIDRNDFLFVIEVERNYWGQLPQEAWEWLRGRNF